MTTSRACRWKTPGPSRRLRDKQAVGLELSKAYDKTDGYDEALNSLKQPWIELWMHIEWMDEGLLNKMVEVFANERCRGSAMDTDEDARTDFCIEVLEGMPERCMDGIRDEEDLLQVQQVMTGTRLLH